MNVIDNIYAGLLYAYPREFRVRFGGEMRQVFRDRRRAVAETHDFWNLFRFLAASAKDWAVSVFKERFAGAGFGAALRRPATIAKLAAFLCLFAGAETMRAYVISAGSMEGSLRVGDHVLADRLHSKVGEIGRGDMITFRYPRDTSQTYVKRVIGLPGDRIQIVDKQVIRNGRRLVERYAQHVSPVVDPQRDTFAEVTVPAESFFVLGDNRDNSSDSRSWGFVPRANVVGKPWIVYWSYDAPQGKTRWERTPMVLHSEAAEEVAP